MIIIIKIFYTKILVKIRKYQYVTEIMSSTFKP